MPVVRFGHVGDDGDGPGGARMDPMFGELRNAGRDIPEACGDGLPPGIHRVDGDSTGVQEILDL